MTLPPLTIAEAARLIAARKLSPVELTDMMLDRIAALDGKLASYVTVTADRARADARRAEAEIMSGAYKGPLHGIPYGLKDVFDTAGILTTAHSKLLANNVPTRDATAAARMVEAGGVLLGKQATWEFAHGGPCFDLPWPPARNPWDTARSPQGSSSGTAAAIAAGLCLGGLGTDTGGSIRLPACACGVAGLKPTYGLVSRTGVVPNSWSFDHAGPLAWTVEDCAILLQAIAGHDPADPASADHPIPDYRAALGRGVAGLKIGVARDHFDGAAKASPEILAGIERAIGVLAELGAEVSDIALPSLQAFIDAKTIITMSEIFTVHEQDLQQRPGDFAALTRHRFLPGGLIRATDYIQAMRTRWELSQTLDRAFDRTQGGVDIIVSATVLEMPALLDRAPPGLLGAQAPFPTMPFNVNGSPALSLCCGFTDDGMPLAIQLAARPFDEATLLAVGHAYEQATPWRDRRPDIVSSPVSAA